MLCPGSLAEDRFQPELERSTSILYVAGLRSASPPRIVENRLVLGRSGIVTV
jgi:hypothetical protein